MPIRECPFCGKVAKFYPFGTGGLVQLRCFCGVLTKPGGEEELTDLWNARANDIRAGMGIIQMRPAGDYIEGLKDFIASFTPEERQVLVEIGSYAGESTRLFAESFKLVFAIDPWDTLPEVFNGGSIEQYNLGIKQAERVFDSMQKEHPNVIKLKGMDTLFLGMFAPGSIDVLYIDGFHDFESVSENIRRWAPLVKNEGYICGHDFYKTTPGVMDAVTFALKIPDEVFKDYSWKIKKTQELIINVKS